MTIILKSHSIGFLETIQMLKKVFFLFDSNLICFFFLVHKTKYDDYNIFNELKLKNFEKIIFCLSKCEEQKKNKKKSFSH